MQKQKTKIVSVEEWNETEVETRMHRLSEWSMFECENGDGSVFTMTTTTINFFVRYTRNSIRLSRTKTI